MLKGDLSKLKQSMKNQTSLLNNSQFDDSFKGIFGPFSYNNEVVQATKELIEGILKEMDK